MMKLPQDRALTKGELDGAMQSFLFPLRPASAVMNLRAGFFAVHSELGSISRFGIVGILATAVYYGVAQAAALLGTTPATANLVAYLAGTSISFFGHLFFTFRKRSRFLRRLTRFLLVSSLGYVFTHVLLFLSMEMLSFPFWLATLVIVAILPAVNWIANRFWAFA